MEARWTVHDHDLAARFAAGDEAAVRGVYARFAGPILTVALGTLGKRDLADEVVQTTMLKAWRASASFDPSRELAPWLYAIARRVAIDVYRREARVGTPEELHDDQAAVVPLSFERTWEAWEVRCALDRLPPDEREVVRLAALPRHDPHRDRGAARRAVGNGQVAVEPGAQAPGGPVGARGQGHRVRTNMTPRTGSWPSSYCALATSDDRQVPAL